MKNSEIHTEEREEILYVAVCHDLGAPYFTVYMLRCGTEHEHGSIGEDEGGGGGGGRHGKSSYDTKSGRCESGAANRRINSKLSEVIQAKSAGISSALLCGLG